MKHKQMPGVIYTDRELQPMFLSDAEAANPQQVLGKFFSLYTLPDFRACFGSLLNDALNNPALPRETTEAHQTFAMEVIQVMEAAFVLDKRD